MIFPLRRTGWLPNRFTRQITDMARIGKEMDASVKMREEPCFSKTNTKKRMKAIIEINKAGPRTVRNFKRYRLINDINL